MTIEDLGLTGEPDDPRAARRRRNQLVIGAVVVAVAFLGVGAGATLLLTGRSLTNDAPPGAGPRVCVAQVAIAFAKSGSQSADEVMRGTADDLRLDRVVGAADFAEEPQADVFERFKRYYSDERAKLFRIEATPAILWVSRSGQYELNQLAINAYASAGVKRVKPEQVAIEDPCTGAMRLTSNPNVQVPTNSTAPRPQTPELPAPSSR